MAKKLFCFWIAALAVLLTGCWNNRPITTLSIVSGVGIDKTDDGKIEITVQIVGLQKDGTPSSSQSGGGSTLTLCAQGDTTFDAVRNLIARIGKKPYYAQAQVIVIGEKAAREGLNDIWDFFERDNETNKLMKVLVVKNGTAKSVVKANSKFQTIGAEEIKETLESKAFGKDVSIKAYQLSVLLQQPQAGIVTGVIDPLGNSELSSMKIEGGAVFKHAKMLGYFDNDETRGYLLAKDQIQSTILTVNNPKEKGKLLSLEVIRSNGKISASFNGDKPVLSIEAVAQGNIGDEQGSPDVTDNQDVIAIEKEAADLMKLNIQAMLQKSQKIFDCDVLDFSDLLNKYHPKEFAGIENNWDTIYRNADINVKAEFVLVRPGIIQKPAYRK